ncbi:DUF2786 domain-containing protein [Oxalobacter aliiformigenes]|uniref:DUF2786 domain-containing protein n=1 Tax=Oxalobacter aliiformigenes TaxID=2946593 RepID=UPI0022B01FAD|nr:DUF2786 domain-containing protein [Oxalobacter aliiformigenes]MCZ4065923.1 DUF2786 domain-containing protein [Oxalobacter aliiformigenes]WAV98677.1 DUF2786 domain-containing protein [Oxalobacter aliiformigenes]
MIDQKILDKIKKCLELSKSNNENEAAVALAQARKLMDLHQVSMDDIDLAAVKRERQSSTAQERPPVWETTLALDIAAIFGCRSTFGDGKYSFIGLHGAPGIAAYAFSVLLRQVLKKRQEYIRTLDKRLKRTTKTRKADAYCFGWIYKATEKVREKELTSEEQALIEKYIDTCMQVSGDLKPTNRVDLDKDINSIIAGQTDGAKVNYFQGVGSHENALKIGGC